MRGRQRRRSQRSPTPDRLGSVSRRACICARYRRLRDMPVPSDTSLLPTHSRCRHNARDARPSRSVWTGPRRRARGSGCRERRIPLSRSRCRRCIRRIHLAPRRRRGRGPSTDATMCRCVGGRCSSLQRTAASSRSRCRRRTPRTAFASCRRRARYTAAKKCRRLAPRIATQRRRGRRRSRIECGIQRRHRARGHRRRRGTCCPKCTRSRARRRTGYQAPGGRAQSHRRAMRRRRLRRTALFGSRGPRGYRRVRGTQGPCKRPLAG